MLSSISSFTLIMKVLKLFNSIQQLVILASKVYKRTEVQWTLMNFFIFCWLFLSLILFSCFFFFLFLQVDDQSMTNQTLLIFFSQSYYYILYPQTILHIKTIDHLIASMIIEQLFVYLIDRKRYATYTLYSIVLLLSFLVFTVLLFSLSLVTILVTQSVILSRFSSLILLIIFIF